MGYKTSFLDNEVYGADDVSRIFSHLVRGGVVPYPDNLTVAQSLNQMTAEVVSDGVGEFGGLAVMKTENGVKIGAGAGFFKSGVAIDVDVDGIELNTPEEVDLYIYFAYEKDFNRVELYASQEQPTGDVLLLAKLLADGTIIDKRQYARPKIVPNVINYYHDFSVNLKRFGEQTEYKSDNSVYYTMPHGGFKYLILRGATMQTIQFYPLSNLAELEEEVEKKIQINASTCYTYLKVYKTGNLLRVTSSRDIPFKDDHTYYLTVV